MKILSLVKRWEHHTTSGGYDRVAEFVGAQVLARRLPVPFRQKVAHAFPYLWQAPFRHLVDYQLADRIVELAALRKLTTGRFDICHCLYGDEQLDLLLRRRSSYSARLTATFHLPWQRSAARFTGQHRDFLHRLDGAITVSSDLADKLRRETSIRRVAFIPHGIDTHVFSPGEAVHQTPGRIRILTVGSHMRDLALVERIARHCRDKSLPFDFVYISAAFHPEGFGMNQAFVFRTKISEEELVREYRSAALLLLPVTMATANNSILESLACGTPVASTAVGGIPDYMDESSGWLFPPGEQDAWLAFFERVARCPEMLSVKRGAARAQAEKFSWPLVGARTLAFYQEIAS